MYYLKDDYECFIRCKTRAAAELQNRSILYPSSYFIEGREGVKWELGLAYF